MPGNNGEAESEDQGDPSKKRSKGEADAWNKLQWDYELRRYG